MNTVKIHRNILQFIILAVILNSVIILPVFSFPDRIGNKRIIKKERVKLDLQEEGRQILLSPNGKKVAFTYHPQMTTGSSMAVAIQEVTSSTKNTLSLGEFSYPDIISWSPDSKYIFVMGISYGHKEYPERYLLKINVKNNDIKIINKNVAYPSPNENLFLVVKNSDKGNPEIYVTNKDFKILKKLQIGYKPIWSPNGNWIAFSKNNKADHFEPWVMNKNGGNLRRLISWDQVFKKTWTHYSYIINCFWLNNNRLMVSIVVQKGKYKNYSIWEVDINGKLKSITEGVGLVDISTRTQKLLIRTWEDTTPIYWLVTLKS